MYIYIAVQIPLILNYVLWLDDRQALKILFYMFVEFAVMNYHSFQMINWFQNWIEFLYCLEAILFQMTQKILALDYATDLVSSCVNGVSKILERSNNYCKKCPLCNIISFHLMWYNLILVTEM